MNERRDWMVVYRQGKGRTFKRSRVVGVTWQEAHDAANEMVEVNAYLPPSRRYEVFYVGTDATEVWVDRYPRKGGRYIPIEREDG